MNRESADEETATSWRASARLSLREAATELAIEPIRLVRLSWTLRVSSHAKVIPRELVHHLQGEDDTEERYTQLLHWLLDNLHHLPKNGDSAPTGESPEVQQ
jgi:hypothetical protein